MYQILNKKDIFFFFRTNNIKIRKYIIMRMYIYIYSFNIRNVNYISSLI